METYCTTEDILAMDKEVIVEEIIFAISSVCHDGEILKHFQACFGISTSEFLKAEENASRKFKEPNVSVRLKSIKARNLQYITEAGQGVKCVVRIGENEMETTEENIAYEWNLDYEFICNNFCSDEMEITIWEEQEEMKGNFSKVWLRSLDNFSRKIRSSLKNQNLANLSFSLLSDGKNAPPEKTAILDTSEPRLVSSKVGLGIGGSHGMAELKQKGKRRDTIHVSESNWVANAFATLRKSNSKKTNQEEKEKSQLSRERFLDIRFHIPTFADSTVDKNWRVKSEKSFFAKYDSNGKGRSKGSIVPGCKMAELNSEAGHIKAKSEVSVKRQLFRDCSLETSSTIPENGSAPEENSLNFLRVPGANTTNEKNYMHTSSSMRDFSKINLSDDQTNNANHFSSDSGLNTKEPETPMKKEILRSTARNDFQLWKRMSLSLRDKGFNLGDDEENELGQKTDWERLPQKETAAVQALKEEGETETTNVKMKIGSSSFKLRDLFTKINSKGIAEEEAIVLPASSKTEICSPIKPPMVQLCLQMHCSITMLQIPSVKLFTTCLEQLLRVEKDRQGTDDEEFGLYLPLTSKSKIILKSLIFVYNIPEAQVSLACWNVLTEGYALPLRQPFQKTLPNLLSSESKEELANSSTQENFQGISKERVVEKKRNKKLLGVGGRFHPQFMFHWLTKIEAAVSSFAYSEEEETTIAGSVQGFIKDFCKQLERIHSAFPVSHSSHLSYGLRCGHLLAESKSIQNILRKSALHLAEDVTWPKCSLLEAVYVHAKNWTKALDTEIRCGTDSTSLLSSVDTSTTREDSELLHVDQSESQTSSAVSDSLLQAILDGEKAMLAINDFIMLGEKVYEANFKNELDESYLQVVWPIVSSVLVSLLSPIRSILQSSCSASKAMLTTGLESIGSLWNLLIRMSKLQRFQNGKEKGSFTLSKPEVFSETFFLLCRLWLDNCLMEAKCQQYRSDDFLQPNSQDGLSTSARELVDLIIVIQEKLKRISFPSDKKLRESLTTFLEDGAKSLVESYQIKMCNLIQENFLPINTLTPQLCIAANNIDHVCLEAEKLASLLSPRREKKDDHIFSFREPTRDACFFLFTKSLPRLAVWIRNGLCHSGKENSPDSILDWIKCALEPILEITPQNEILLRHFWDFVFCVVKEKLKFLVNPEDFRVIGNFMENVYFLYKRSLHLDLHSQSQIEFQEFMASIQLKGSSTPEVIHLYFEERFKEQEMLSSLKEQLVLNAYFCRDRGLRVDLFMAPLVDTSREKRPSLVLPNDNICRLSKDAGKMSQINSIAKTFRMTSHIRQKTSEVIGSLSKSQTVSFYVKAMPVPTAWFRKVRAKKTKATTRNPPVFEEHISFNIKAIDEGVKKGGFLLLRLKYNSIGSSGVESETLLPLKDIPLLTPEESKGNTYSSLKLSIPTSIQDYKSLQELESRKQDREALSFITNLYHSYWSR